MKDHYDVASSSLGMG
ncbi:Protein of unknown function [Bacillus mycoides]|nr:Protein of unknown function [Bacillus mycoides]